MQFSSSSLRSQATGSVMSPASLPDWESSLLTLKSAVQSVPFHGVVHSCKISLQQLVFTILSESQTQACWIPHCVSGDPGAGWDAFSPGDKVEFASLEPSCFWSWLGLLTRLASFKAHSLLINQIQLIVNLNARWISGIKR